MLSLIITVFAQFRHAFADRLDLVIENVALRQQLAAYRHKHGRPRRRVLCLAS